jgi:hypothetical protein
MYPKAASTLSAAPRRRQPARLALVAVMRKLLITLNATIRDNTAGASAHS